MENEEMMNVPDEENQSFDGEYANDGGMDDVYGNELSEGEMNAEAKAWFKDPDAKASESPSVKKLLDELTDDGSGEDSFVDVAGKGADKDALAGVSRDVSASRPKTAEEEEMELLRHVKSERGRERIKSIISARKEAEIQKSEVQSEIEHFKGMLSMTGLDGKDLAQTMEYGRLVGQGDERSLELALNMLEQQRDMICKKLGRSAPGVDLLSDLPELKSAVDKRELSMDHALKLAKYERAERMNERMNQQFEDNDLQRILKSETVVNNLSGISESCDNYFRRFEGEADHQAKMDRLRNYLSDPDTLNEFIRTVPPPMWFNHFKFLYENMPMPPQRNDYAQQPLRSRSLTTGYVADNPNMSNLERIKKRMDEMGI